MSKNNCKKKVNGRTKPFTFTINGEPASKSNQRRLVMLGGKPRFIKSKKALDYGSAFKAQVPQLSPLFLEDVQVNITIHYASRRPDLDESLILDLMQDYIYRNDRQVKKKVVTWGGVDKTNPHAVISVTAYNP